MRERAGTARAVCDDGDMRQNSRENAVADIFVLIGLALVGAAVYLAFGAAATLAYAGLLMVAAGLAQASQRDWKRIE